MAAMKLILIISIIYINYSSSEFVEINAKRVAVKTYPKKVLPGLYKIINNGKYNKKIPTKKAVNDRDYTIFPPMNKEGNLHNIHGSTYFAIENVPEHRHRIRKDSTGYGPLTLRKKRSAVADDIKGDIRGKKGSKDKNPKTAARKQKKPSKQIPRTKSKQPTRTKLRSKLSNTTRKPNVKATKHKSAKIIKPKVKVTKAPPKTHVAHNHSAAHVAHNHSAAHVAHNHSAAKNINTPKSRKDRRQPKEGRRLIAAKDAMIEQYPYVVSIQKDKQHWCAGALLNPRLVITTANCLWRADRISRMRVRAGSRHTDRGGQVARVQEVMKHPGWKIRRNPDNDVALLLLDRNIRFSHAVHGVDLSNRIMMPAFDDAWITSWGAERRDGIYDTKGMSLQVYHARLLDRAKCNNVTQRFGVTVTNNFICLAQTGKRAPCTRDTGAPAVSDGVLWGLASWGIRKLCGTERFPAVFSYLASQSNMDFIVNATHFLMADERYYPFPDRLPRPRVTLSTPTPLTLPF